MFRRCMRRIRCCCFHLKIIRMNECFVRTHNTFAKKVLDRTKMTHFFNLIKKWQRCKSLHGTGHMVGLCEVIQCSRLLFKW